MISGLAHKLHDGLRLARTETEAYYTGESLPIHRVALRPKNHRRRESIAWISWIKPKPPRGTEFSPPHWVLWRTICRQLWLSVLYPIFLGVRQFSMKHHETNSVDIPFALPPSGPHKERKILKRILDTGFFGVDYTNIIKTWLKG